ncbi:hypothetical protein NY_014-144 [NY_014 poxvirus]|uniref:hypothetical protein n=1 Tax=NY_014 poxvirus TaxID=2025360 RepID=UPI000B9A0426|nr:hypothetical protein CKM51_gp144 [NY_014 poxvirus]AST09545.1 hypothetical protein NY_014-144 [NY_014 poxvirus]
MSILNTIRFLEKTSFYTKRRLFKEKTYLTHKKWEFVFYEPKVSTIRRYLEIGGINHNDFVILGKATYNGVKMLFIYMNLAYYGVSKVGSIYKLGSTIDKLSLTKSHISLYSESLKSNYLYDYSSEDDDDFDDDFE